MSSIVFCQPCRDRRNQRDKGLVETAPLCDECRRKRRERVASQPKRVRTYEPGGPRGNRFWADPLAIELVADGLIHGSRVYPIERREASKIMLLRGTMDNRAIAKQCGVHVRSVDRLSTMLREGKLEMRVN